MHKLINLLCIALVSASHVKAQDVNDNGARRNSIKLDLTSHLLYSNSLVLAYERVTRPNQSFVLSAGAQQFKLFRSFGSNIRVLSNGPSSGYRFGGEYRFYLKTENKFSAPRGVYVGPYFTHHRFSNQRTIEVNQNGTINTGNIEMDLNVTNIGVQLGYQFVVSNRCVIDFVFVGPSFSNYQFKATTDGTFTINTDNITNEIVLGLLDRFPGLKEFIEEGTFSENGKANKWAYGYRYQFQIGYHFGRKRK